jgi:N-acetylmuramoyl-L-alanine amidase
MKPLLAIALGLLLPALAQASGFRESMREGAVRRARYAKSRDPRDLEVALTAYSRAAALAPRGRAAAPWLARARLLLEHRADKSAAIAALREITRRYPRAREARTAKRLLRLLRAFDVARPATRVVAVREETSPAATRIVVELDGALEKLPAPLALAPLDHVRLKLAGVRAPKSLLGARPGRGLASRIRLRKHGRGLLLDAQTRSPVRARVFHLTAPHRLVVDLSAPEAVPPDAGPAPPARAFLPRRVVIDPGHGGTDPGAVGRRTRLREKDVTLRIARRLQALFRKVGVEALLTREGDETVALRDRTAFANDLRADLFLSIHANSNPDRKRHGLETYYLDTTRDRYAKRLADRENRGGEAGDLGYILADLHTRSNVQASMQLAGRVLRATVEHLSIRYEDIVDHGVKPALFYVLLGAKMPAILIETSYLTNARDERRLRRDAYLQRLAEGIFLGVRRFALGATLARR